MKIKIEVDGVKCDNCCSEKQTDHWRYGGSRVCNKCKEEHCHTCVNDTIDNFKAYTYGDVYVCQKCCENSDIVKRLLDERLQLKEERDRQRQLLEDKAQQNGYDLYNAIAAIAEL